MTPDTRHSIDAPGLASTIAATAKSLCLLAGGVALVASSVFSSVYVLRIAHILPW